MKNLSENFKCIAAVLTLFISTLAFADLTVISPANHSNADSSVNVVASATPSSPDHRISAMQIYVNSIKVFKTEKDSLNTSVPLSSGTNRMQVKAWDTAGNLFEKVIFVNSGNSGSPSPDPTGFTVIANIDEMSGWGSCDACAGKDAKGNKSVFWMKQGIHAPSLDGNSAQFHLGGNIPYGDAIWWQHLINDPGKVRRATHFIYDTYFYYTNAHAVQGLEFNVSQYFGGKGFIYGMQCNVRAGEHWDVSTVRDKSKHQRLEQMKWQNTGISCPAPPTNTWNHVTIEAERTSDEQVHFISLTFNEVKHYLDIYAPARVAPSGWTGVTAHFQMNGNTQQEDYSAWVDKFSLSYR